MFTGPRSDVDYVIGDTDRVFVVFDHDDGVAQIAQANHRLDEAVVVALMESDRRLVQHVEHPDQSTANL